MCGRLSGMAIGWGCCLAMLAGSHAAAADWPQWRGPQRDGCVPGLVAPKVWPKQLMARYKVADTPVWAHPAVLGKRLLIKDRSSLALWTL